MKRQPLSRGEKRLFKISAVVLLAVVGFGFWRRHNAALTQIPAAPRPPVPNAYDVYFAAGTGLVVFNSPPDAVLDAKKRTPAEKKRLYTPTRRALYVARNATAWQQMALARKMESLAPSQRGNFGAISHRPLRDLSRANAVRTRFLCDQKQWSAAMNSLLDGSEMSAQLSQGASLLPFLVAAAVAANAAPEAERIVEELNAIQARNAKQRLEKIRASRPRASEILTEEKWVSLSFYENLSAMPGVPSNAVQNAVLRAVGTVSAPSNARMHNEFIAQADKPVKAQQYPPRPKGLRESLAFSSYDVLIRSSFSFARLEAYESMLLLRLALRIYRLENGVYPENLEDLAPQVLAQIPRDPFGAGENLRYSKRGNAYRVWSIGPDGKDDKGVSIATKPGATRPVVGYKSQGDIVIEPAKKGITKTAT